MCSGETPQMDRSAVAKPKTNRKHGAAADKREKARKSAGASRSAGRKATAALPQPANDTDVREQVSTDTETDDIMTDVVLTPEVIDEAALAAAPELEEVDV